jgi:hypothetical protein
MCYGTCKYEDRNGDCRLSGRPKVGAACLAEDEDQYEEDEENKTKQSNLHGKAHA